MSQAAPDARAMNSSTCGSIDIAFLRNPLSVRMRLEEQLPAPPIGYVRVELGRGEIGMSEHFLNRSQVCPSLEEVSRKRVAEEMRVDARRIEARLLGEGAEDEERAGPRQRAAAGVQEELAAVPAVEVRAAA